MKNVTALTRERSLSWVTCSALAALVLGTSPMTITQAQSNPDMPRLPDHFPGPNDRPPAIGTLPPEERPPLGPEALLSAFPREWEVQAVDEGLLDIPGLPAGDQMDIVSEDGFCARQRTVVQNSSSLTFITFFRRWSAQFVARPMSAHISENVKTIFWNVELANIRRASVPYSIDLYSGHREVLAKFWHDPDGFMVGNDDGAFVELGVNPMAGVTNRLSLTVALRPHEARMLVYVSYEYELRGNVRSHEETIELPFTSEIGSRRLSVWMHSEGVLEMSECDTSQSNWLSLEGTALHAARF